MKHAALAILIFAGSQTVLAADRPNIVFMLFGLSSTASAHSGHDHHRGTQSKENGERPSPHERTWELSEQQSVQASFVLEKDGRLTLESRDGSVVTVRAGDLSETDQQWLKQRQLRIQRLNTEPNMLLVAMLAERRREAAAPRPSIAEHFEPFQKSLGLRWDDRYLYVESNGMPDHDLMVGITAWQQQLPLPQRYTGSNAWQIPLHPVPARNPMSAKTHFFRGAIALAVNGVPIFNPLNNRRADTNVIGELDKWGGHSGRADDYHYHIAPVHLEKTVGKGSPVAVALDGYPIYGYEDADGSKPKGLDWLNGHKDADGNYHYHATKTYPYLNGGFYGEVVERGGQVDPQPRGQPLRPSTGPLRGAKITGFANPKPGSYRVEYDVYGDKRSVAYDVADDGTAVYRFTASNGTRTESHRARARRDARRPRLRGDGEQPGGGRSRPEGKRPRRRRPNGEGPGRDRPAD